MTKCMILTIKATVAFVFGLGQMLAPARILAAAGVAADAALVIEARYLGLCVLGIGLICWFAGRAEDSKFRRKVIQSLLVIDALGLVLAVLAQFSGVLNVLGWAVVAAWLVVTVGMAYCHFT